MKIRLLAAVALCILVLDLGGSTFADTRAKTVKKSQTNQLASLLPASDGIATINIKRFFSDALPVILSGNQPMLAQIIAKIDEIKAKTGIDIRQFEYLAAGVTAKKVKLKEYDLQPIILSRGQISSASLIGAAKLASNGKYREERIGDRTVYIFSAKEIDKQKKPQPPAGKDSDPFDKAIDKLSEEIAVTAYDANTLAAGSLALVRQTLEAKTKPSSELMALLGRKEMAVVNFAANVPAGMSSLVPLDNDELGKNIDSIRYLYGNMDVIGDEVAVNLTAKTLQNSQAQGLLETLEGLQLVGKAFLGSSKNVNNQVYARMIDNVKFSAKGNEVMFDLRIPQSDLSLLVATLKVK